MIKRESIEIKTERKIIWGGGTIWYIGKCYPQLASADEYEIIVSHINDRTFLKRIVRSVPFGKLGKYTKAIYECHIFCIDNNGIIEYRESDV